MAGAEGALLECLVTRHFYRPDARTDWAIVGGVWSGDKGFVGRGARSAIRAPAHASAPSFLTMMGATSSRTRVASRRGTQA